VVSMRFLSVGESAADGYEPTVLVWARGFVPGVAPHAGRQE